MEGQKTDNLFSESAKALFSHVPQTQQANKEGNEDFDKLKERRENNAIEIRRENRAKDLNKKRYLNQNQGGQTGQQGQALSKIQIKDEQLKNRIDEWLKQDFSKNVEFDELFACINSNDIYRQHYGVIGLRKILSVEDGPPIQYVIDNNMVPRFIELIKQQEHVHLQLEAAWALTNIASGTSHQTQTIIDKGGIPLFVQLLRSPHSEIAEQALWALGNIAGDCAVYRDMILKSGGLEPLINIISNAQNKNTIKHGTWALSNLCRGRPLPKFELVKNAIPILAQVIIRSQESEVLTDAAWALSYLSDGDETRIDMVINTGVIPSLIQLLKHPFLSILIPSLRTLGNIVTGNAQQTNKVLSEKNALESFFELLNHQKRSVRREACWTISNITAGTAEQIHHIVARSDYIQKLTHLMENDCNEIIRESTWVLSNATAQGSPDDVKSLVDQGVLEIFVSKLKSDDPKTIAVVLEAINNILECGKNNFMVDGVNIFIVLLDKINAVDKIEELQQHENDDIYKKALKILENHFDLEQAL